jgi:hypothetical protein
MSYSDQTDRYKMTGCHYSPPVMTWLDFVTVGVLWLKLHSSRESRKMA